jgi:threonine dehydrogenase-like Zn-dependent dehydrogenase
MKTIRLEEPGHLTLLSTEAPSALQAEEALVRVHRIGVCGTDIHAFGGKQPFFS